VSFHSRQLIISIILSLILIIVLVIPGNAANKPTITISSLNISGEIKEFRLVDGTWTISPWEKGIGHLEDTGWFDNPTNIVLAGHSTMPNGKPGVFATLSNLSIGQDIVLFDGKADRHYQVSDIQVVAADDVSVVMPTDHERLTLITCEIGSYDEVNQGYTQRLVVVADRVS
jgi:LPXTG-site transpeptidase (sortase) family protein